MNMLNLTISRFSDRRRRKGERGSSLTDTLLAQTTKESAPESASCSNWKRPRCAPCLPWALNFVFRLHRTFAGVISACSSVGKYPTSHTCRAPTKDIIGPDKPQRMRRFLLVTVYRGLTGKCYHISCFLDCWGGIVVKLEDFDRSGMCAYCTAWENAPHCPHSSSLQLVAFAFAYFLPDLTPLIRE